MNKAGKTIRNAFHEVFSLVDESKVNVSIDP